MRAIGIAVAVCVWGCGTFHPAIARAPLALENPVVTATVAMWQRLGLPYPDDCREERELVHILIATPDELATWCHDCSCWGCIRRYQLGVWPFRLFGGWDSYLVILEGQPPSQEDGVIITETLHWLEICSGIATAGNRRHDGPVWNTVYPAVRKSIAN